MKSKVLLLVNLSLLVILIAVFSNPAVKTIGASDSVTGSFSSMDTDRLKIGIVSLRKVFMDSKRIADYKQEATIEHQKIQSQLDNAAKEIEAGEGALKALVRGSPDYIEQWRELNQKKTKLESDRKFYSQLLSMNEQLITEQIYKAVLEQCSVVARQKRLALVLEKSEIELPASSPNQLELVMGTNKVLYSGGCVDITKEVTEGVDSAVLTK